MAGTPINPAGFRDFEYRGWESCVSAYDTFFGPLTKLTIEPLLDGAKVTNGRDVLDVATGPGYVAAAAQRRGARVIGVDFSEKMVARAKSINGTYISFHVGDAEKLAFQSETFDSITINFGILHLAQPEIAMREAYRVLRHNGHFAFTVWAKPEEAVGFAIALRAIETFGNMNVSLPQGPPFFRFSEESESEMTLEATGFTVTSIQKLPMVWQLNSADDFFQAFFQGTARTGGLLRAQSPDALLAIRDGVKKSCQNYEADGKLRIPMPALVISAVKNL